MAGGKTGLPILADTRSLARLARNLRATAPEVWKECRLALRASAEPVLATARSNVGAYSPAIAATGRIRVTGGGIVKVVFGQKGRQTHDNAAAVENKGKGFVRHPVFIPRAQLPGPPGRWTSLHSHPAFLAPALEQHKAAVMAATEAAVMVAIKRGLGA